MGGRGRARAWRAARWRIKREGIWGLSLLVVPPGRCSRPGVGSRAAAPRARLRATARAGRIILASPDPRAIRAYSRLGLDLHPCFVGQGRAARRAPRPTGLREGTARRHPVHRGRRPHRPRRRRTAPSIETLAGDGADAAGRCPSAATPSSGDGALRTLAALDDEGAAASCCAARWRGSRARRSRVELHHRARSSGRCRSCLEAGLRAAADAGVMFLERRRRRRSGPICRAAPSCESLDTSCHLTWPSRTP